jgi:hypothetical protein
MENEIKENEIQVSEKNSFQRIIGVIFAPFKTMEDIERKPNFILPLILVIISSVLFYYMTFDGMFEMTMEQQKEILMNQNPDYTEADFDNSNDLTKKIMLITGAVTPFTLIIAYLISAAFALLAFKIILKGEGSFKKYFSVVSYASVIVVVAYLVKIAVYIITKDYNLSVYATSLAGILPSEDSLTIFGSFLATIEIFSILHYIVLAIGFKIVSKLEWIKVIGYLVLMYLISLGLTLSSVLISNIKM